MGVREDDWAKEQYFADRAAVVLADAEAEAERIALERTAVWSGHALKPVVTVRITSGPHDEPVFAFTVAVDLADDLAASEYPIDEIQELLAELRERIADSSVDEWGWFVKVLTKSTTHS